MEIVILGCGPSYGIPNIRGLYGSCDPNNPKNKRSRACVYMHDKDTSLLFDTPPELRTQLYDNKIENVDALIYTHMHADHVMGIDDARVFTYDNNEAKNVNIHSLPVYLNENSKAEFEQRFGFYLKPLCNYADQKIAPFVLNPVKAGQAFQIKNLTLFPIAQNHGSVESLGFKIDDSVAYTTDLNYFINFDVEQLKGVKLWVLGGVTAHETHKHVSLRQALEWFDIVKPERMIITHLSASMDYDTITAQLPKGIELAYDGMRINL